MVAGVRLSEQTRLRELMECLLFFPSRPGIGWPLHRRALPGGALEDAGDGGLEAGRASEMTSFTPSRPRFRSDQQPHVVIQQCRAPPSDDRLPGREQLAVRQVVVNEAQPGVEQQVSRLQNKGGEE